MAAPTMSPEPRVPNSAIASLLVLLALLVAGSVYAFTRAQKVRKLSAADPSIPSVELGELVMVVYRTKKGADQVLTDYEHEFAHPRPRLAYNESGLIIAGGKYRVEVRGIID